MYVHMVCGIGCVFKCHVTLCYPFALLSTVQAALLVTHLQTTLVMVSVSILPIACVRIFAYVRTIVGSVCTDVGLLCVY